MVQTGFDGLISLGVDRKTRGALATADGSEFEEHYTHSSETTLCAKSGRGTCSGKTNSLDPGLSICLTIAET
jgi:hypothetical protein